MGHSAAVLHRQEAALLLLEQRCSLDAQDNEGLTALHLVAIDGATDTCSWILSLKAEVDLRDLSDRTPLHMACSGEIKQGSIRPEIVRLLLAAAASPCATEKTGRQPLHSAAQGGSIEMCSFLFDMQANAEAITNDGATPLHFAAGQQREG